MSSWELGARDPSDIKIKLIISVFLSYCRSHGIENFRRQQKIINNCGLFPVVSERRSIVLQQSGSSAYAALVADNACSRSTKDKRRKAALQRFVNHSSSQSGRLTSTCMRKIPICLPFFNFKFAFELGKVSFANYSASYFQR